MTAEDAGQVGRELGEVLDLVDQVVAHITDDEVERRLRQVREVAADDYAAYADLFTALHPRKAPKC